MLLVAALFLPIHAGAQQWPVYGGDAGGTRYSRLDQIYRLGRRQAAAPVLRHARRAALGD
ncbi:MAG: hypothetical protein HY235_04720 [Acidobacteria bacterium]|nr:hypothetical protein [Acidobacteriota bacterium]